MSEVETEAHVAALRSVNDDFAKLVGEQRLTIAAKQLKINDLRDALSQSTALIEKMMRDGGLVSVPISSWTSETRSETKSFWCVPTWHLGDAEIAVREARAALSPAKPGAAGT